MLTFRVVVPVRTEELEISFFDDPEEFALLAIRTAERREATEQDVEDHSERPHVYLQAVTCTQQQRRSTITYRYKQRSKQAAREMIATARIGLPAIFTQFYLTTKCDSKEEYKKENLTKLS